MKKVLSILTTAMVVCILSGSAWAVPWTWTDVYTPLNAPVFFNAPKTLSFTHDIKDNGFDPFQDFVVSYVLELGLYDDAARTNDDGSEKVKIDLPGLITDGTFEVNWSDIERGWSIVGLLTLNTTGTLGVNLSWVKGDFYFSDSVLKASGNETAPAPVPEPATLLLLGSALLGLASFRKKSK